MFSVLVKSCKGKGEEEEKGGKRIGRMREEGKIERKRESLLQMLRQRVTSSEK